MEHTVYPSDEKNDVLSMARYTKAAFERVNRAVPPELDELIEFCEDVVGDSSFLNKEKHPKDLAQMWNMMPYAPGFAGDEHSRALAKTVRASLADARAAKRVKEEDTSARASLCVELASENRARPTEYVFYDESKKAVVVAVDKADFLESHAEEFGEDYYDEEAFENYEAFQKIAFKKRGFVAMNDGYDAEKTFEEFLAVVDDDDAFEALEEKYSEI